MQLGLALAFVVSAGLMGLILSTTLDFLKL